MLTNAARLCTASYGAMWLCEGDGFRMAAIHGELPAAYVDEFRLGAVYRPSPKVPLARVAATHQPVQVEDCRLLQSYIDRDPLAVSAIEIAGIRTLVTVPMLKEGALVGAIAIYRTEVRPFTEKQIELVQNFAAQAVIAIENARLLNQLRDSLDQQTATSEVLRVISSSPGELEPVFQAVLEKATRICEATFGTLYRFDGVAFYHAAGHGTPDTLIQVQKQQGSFVPEPGTLMHRVMHTRAVAHSADYSAESARGLSAKFGGARSTVVVPMLKDNELVGAFAIYRQEVRPFTGKQIELVQNFAAQAVIAIENARLLNELRESLEQQTATSNVLEAISASPGNLRPVFEAILQNAVRLCGAKFGNLYLREGNGFRAGAMHNAPAAYAEHRAGVVRPSPNSTIWQAAQSKQPAQVPDMTKLQAYVEGDPWLVSTVSLAGHRSVLSVPMLHEDEVIGGITIFRQEAGAFADRQIELLTNFAKQAVIAIENARLVNELRQRTSDLSKSLEDLRSAQDRLVQTEKLASLGQLTAGIAHEIKNPLNFVNNFSSVSVELIDELRQVLGSVHLDSKVRTEISEIADTLEGNLDKVVQHGKRADAIVKNMLLHSRQGSGEHRPVEINALVEESLNLAYHGARAEKQGFNITLERSFDPSAGEVDLFPQEITRVLLNLISNGFYAATKRKAEANGDNYEPTLAAATKNLGNSVEIRIRDNGTGISPEVKEKLFSPFFTTKPAGEGTGLGLSISHDIIVKQHGGSIEVDTEPGVFTEFRVVLPRTGTVSRENAHEPTHSRSG
jgi:signal transduction histidine kinase